MNAVLKSDTGILNDAMFKYLTPDAYTFLDALYNVTDSKELKISDCGDENKGPATLEDIFNDMNLLIPKQEQVIKALELMKILRKGSVHTPINLSAVFRYPEQLIKLSENAKDIYGFINDIDAKKTYSVNDDQGSFNFILQNIDEILSMVNKKDDILEVIDGFKQRAVTCFSRTNLGTDGKGRGILDNQEIMQQVIDNKDAYFEGLDFLIDKLDWYNVFKKHMIGSHLDETDPHLHMGNLRHIWHYAYLDNDKIIQLPKEKKLQELFIGLNERGLITPHDISYLLDDLDDFKPFEDNNDIIFGFIDEYNLMIKGWCNKNKYHNSVYEINILNAAALQSRSSDADSFLIAIDKRKKTILDKMQNYLDNTEWHGNCPAKDHVLSILK